MYIFHCIPITRAQAKQNPDFDLLTGLIFPTCTLRTPNMVTEFLEALATFNKLQNFSGNEPGRIDHFFQQLESYSTAHKWSATKQKEMLSSCLTNTTQNLYCLLQINTTFLTKTYDGIKKDIVSTFRSMFSKYKIEDIIRNLNQTFLETPYHNEISKGQLIRSLTSDVSEQS